MEDQFLSKGQNIELPDELDQIDIVITWDNTEFGVDASAFASGCRRKSPGPTRTSSSTTNRNLLTARFAISAAARRSGPHERLLVHLAAVPDQVDAIALIGSVDTGSFGDLGKLALNLWLSSG